jgi:alginate O-acetyltransferase complex protein AlgI
MLFNSFEFLVFFLGVTLLFWILPHRFRWMLLLGASCGFYMAFIPKYILILLVTILIDYSAALYIVRVEGVRKQSALYLSVFSTCMVLFIFKYFNFFNANLSHLASVLGWNYPVGVLNIILPIGLSFHTFQSLSYVIEVYRGKQPAEKHFGIYALYVMFYPQLVAGPIERPQNLLRQLRDHKIFNGSQLDSGLKLMMWGFFKKVVVADRLAPFVNTLYGAPGSYTGIQLLLATFFFAYQIYCDFSGYSDIARGAARCMGFELMVNFDFPYVSRSISEFWRRWHVSLSSWFKDYVYVPLGGNRVSRRRWYGNLMVTFVISGLWHGANWTFLVWGALNGLYLILEAGTKQGRDQLWRRLPSFYETHLRRSGALLLTFGLTCFAWIFFRASSLGDALLICGKIFSGSSAGGFWPRIDGYGSNYLLNASLVILAMEWIQYLIRHCNAVERVRSLSWMGNLAFYWSGIHILLFWGIFANTAFIYFQF